MWFWNKNRPKKFYMKYVGGFPEWESNYNFKILIYKDKTFKFFAKRKVYLEGNLDRIEILLENEKQLSDRITATRLLTLGIFALAFKKKKMLNNKFVTLKFKEIDLQEVRRKYEDIDIVLTDSSKIIVDSFYNYIAKLKAQY